MKLRFLTSIASTQWSFHAGDTIEVQKLTPEMWRWIKGTDGRDPIAELVKDAEPSSEVAVAPDLPEHAVTTPPGRTGRGRRGVRRDPD